MNKLIMNENVGGGGGNPSSLRGFTLAEVLITLGIIGVVAALTMPPLIQNYKKHVVETRLKRFYSGMNNAVRLANLDYGDVWEKPSEITVHKDGTSVKGDCPNEKYFNKYFAPYIRILKIDNSESCSSTRVTFLDSSSLVFYGNYYGEPSFYTDSVEKCSKRKEAGGSCIFYFYVNSKGVEPYSYGWKNSYDVLERTCINKQMGPNYGATWAYCSKLIQYNGWKIPDNYPYKF